MRDAFQSNIMPRSQIGTYPEVKKDQVDVRAQGSLTYPRKPKKGLEETLIQGQNQDKNGEYALAEGQDQSNLIETRTKKMTRAARERKATKAKEKDQQSLWQVGASNRSQGQKIVRLSITC
jgi:hypothetical protein